MTAPERRAPPAWHDSTRPSEPSSLGPSVFERAAAAPVAARVEGAAFDVCHVGLVLRAVLVVQAIVAIGVAFAAGSLAQWLMLYAGSAGVALIGTLLWLVAACGLRSRLARAPEPAQLALSAALGAVAGLGGWLPIALAVGGGASPGGAVAPALAGAGLGAGIAHWLRLRGRGALPADTSARLAELQSRIRPHFLFNTLNTAMALVRVDPRRAEDILADLAELFRVALLPGGATVTLADEIELAQRYLAIEQARFGERLAIEWDLDDAANRARVPPLLLQPLLENAVRHGIEPAPEGGTIRVKTRLKRGHAVVGVVNTLPSGPSTPGHGMALRNLRERLHLMHDVAAQFDARRDGDTWRVQIVVPA